MRNKSTIKNIVAGVIACAMIIPTAFSTAALAADKIQNSEIKYEIYNGDKLISLINTPIIYDDNYYLPLRETLNAFGINDIQWDNGKIKISMPHSQKKIPYADKCEIEIGSDCILYEDSSYLKSTMSAVPILKNDITYVSEFFFEDLIRVGQIPNYRFAVIRSLSPEAYYEPGEEVFIGTLDEQDNYSSDTPVKRIITDKNGNTMAIVTVENQNPEKLDSLKMDGDKLNIDNYSGLLDAHSISITADGKYVYKNSGLIIYKANERIAYIPVIWQINMPKNNLSALNN